MNWFRLYLEARNDAKLRTLSDAEHRVWFNLLCYAAEQPMRGTIEGVTPCHAMSRGGGVTSKTDITSAVLIAIEVASGDAALLTSTVDKLIDLRILAIDDDGLTFINFERRQYDKVSDMPEKTRLRKAAQREREREQTTPEGVTARDRGVTARDVTPRTEQNREEENVTAADADGDDGGKAPPKPIERRFNRFWHVYPKKRSKQDAWKVWQRLNPDEALTDRMIAAIAALRRTADWTKQDGQFIPYPASWLNAGGWDDETVVHIRNDHDETPGNESWWSRPTVTAG